MNTATEKQYSLIRTLIAEREVPEVAVNVARDAWRAGHMTIESASNLIDQFLGYDRKAPAQTPDAEVPEGMHKFGGVFFKVQRAVHGSGRLYAKALLDQCDGQWGYEIAPGAIRNLSEATVLDPAEARRFGVLMGTCVFCARELTDERSIEAGYGPVCADKNGLPWG